LAIQLLVGSAVYGAGLLWAIWTHRAWNVGELTGEKGEDEVSLALVDTYQEEA